MTRKQLEDLGLTKEQADSVMKINGDDIENAKGTASTEIKNLQTEVEGLKTQVGDRDKQLETLKASTGDNADLKKKIEDLQTENATAKATHESELNQLKIDFAVEKALTGAKAKNIKAVKALLELGEDFEYTSSIDSNTYNKIKLTYDNEDTKKRDVYITQDSSNINKWGILQYFDTLQKGENGQAKADALLKLYNKKTRNLKITNALGDNRVRAGSMVVINLDLGDMKVKNWMLVEKCKHTYKEGEHWMDLTLRGGEFIA